MPVNLHPIEPDLADPENLSGKRRARRAAAPQIVIGLVNIMPNAAIRTTENLFRQLLNLGAPRHRIQLRLFAPRAIAGRENPISSTGQAYENLDDLWNAEADNAIDGLIVSGMESHTAAIEDDPIWPSLQKLTDWAGENTIAAIWSCFSGHAAVQHADGIRRQRLAEKRNGVFQCQKASEHFLTENLPPEFAIPHSRYHELDEAALRAANYQILTWGPQASVDSFTKLHNKSQFLFLQGHPEYSPHMLLGEYCRDVKRFVSGESGDYPNLPENYFDAATVEAFTALRNREAFSPDSVLPPELVRTVLEKLTHPWRTPAEQLFTSWLRHIAEQKTRDWTKNIGDQNKIKAA